LDAHLPDIDGGTVLKRLRGNPRTSGIPVVIVSADAVDRHIQQLLEAGAAAYITKPFDAYHLLRVIDELIRDFGDDLVLRGNSV
jgi:CheY-like chemotaxis protein